MVDGCADLGGCLDIAFVFKGGDGNRGGPGLLFIGPLVLLGLVVVGVQALNPEPPPPPLTERITREVEKRIPHPINNWKIKRAEKKFKEEQEAARKERARQAKLVEKEEAELPKQDGWWAKTKDKLRNKLNKDYEKRHPDAQDESN